MTTSNSFRTVRAWLNRSTLADAEASAYEQEPGAFLGVTGKRCIALLVVFVGVLIAAIVKYAPLQ